MKNATPLSKILLNMSEGDNVYSIENDKVFETTYNVDSVGETRKSKRELEPDELQDLIAEYNRRFASEQDEQEDEQILYNDFEDLINVEFEDFEDLKKALSELGIGYDTYRFFPEDDGGDAVVVTDSVSYLLFIEYGNDALAITSIKQL